ncbi:uncharacterized protein LAESUDRAFT_728255 [Laetiporus sulphureus 93-53]|uniref:Uncharacterized protein n=1 Tax=Laetiporus sulphureus 93-53 TaxID=1314785 RepID=A0A165D9R1_9APHY|nr:uncharacterized protein LAESUDRAFT_728255 [Laetiporus sulphureus 93-53]KZT04395.1 hypothetical protein LAESUDRAFT_728255 [Laetiporus sulphureus 93-53]
MASRMRLPRGKRPSYLRVRSRRLWPMFMSMNNRSLSPCLLMGIQCKDIAMIGVRADVPGVPRAGAIAKPFS